MKQMKIIIDGKEFLVTEGTTVLEAARKAHINIPTLCYLKDVNEIGACRMCLVEIKNMKGLHAACVLPVEDNMEVFTNTLKVRNARKANLELILSDHDKKCLSCVRSTHCELQELAQDLGADEDRFKGDRIIRTLDNLSPSIIRNNNKCILCRRCESVCQHVQETAVIAAVNRGFETTVGSAFEKSLRDVSCIMCGQCIIACPVGALYEKPHIEKVWEMLGDDELTVLVQTAPAVRVALGEEFDMPIGSRTTGQMVTALRQMGFDGVFDANTGADLTIMEEGTELLSRLENNGTLPMITSCSPGWIKYCEHYYPEFIDNLSSCKSPHQMFGAILKSYYAEKMGLDPKKIAVVSVMPCTAKKYESQRPEMEVDGLRDVDAVLTTRELGIMLRSIGVNYPVLESSTFDTPFGAASGAATIFGATGGVTEAAIRTVYELTTGTPMENLEFTPVRGDTDIKEFEVELPTLTLKGAVAHGTGSAKKLLEKIKNKEATYHFIEIMGCKGGCITGGGQPIVNSTTLATKDVYALRSAAIYDEDRAQSFRRSHENEAIKTLYEEFLESPNSDMAHKYLHTSYTERPLYDDDLLTKPSITLPE